MAFSSLRARLTDIIEAIELYARLAFGPRSASSAVMESDEPHQAPSDWLDILAESEAELAAGLSVDGDQVIRELYAAADELERTLLETQDRPALYR